MLRALRAAADPSRVEILQRFFRTGPGEYAEGDVFIGVTVPAVRLLVKRFRDAPLEEVDALLQSPVHEARLVALLLMVQTFRSTRAIAIVVETAHCYRGDAAFHPPGRSRDHV